MELSQTIVGMVLNIVLPLVVQAWDRRRLDAEARERSWNYATWGSVLLYLGPLSMLGWCWVTRRGWRRALGLPVAAVLFVLTSLAMQSVESVWHMLSPKP